MKILMIVAASGVMLSACHASHGEEMGKDTAYGKHGMESWRCSPGTKTRGCTHPAINPPPSRMEHHEGHEQMHDEYQHAPSHYSY